MGGIGVTTTGGRSRPLILLHVAAALFHALVRRDEVFDTMAPLPHGDELAPAE